MGNAIREYLQTLAERFGAGWNRFWFTPIDPLSTSVLRVLTGVVALYWQLTFSPDLVRLFGPNGLISAETLRTWTGPFRSRFTFSYLEYMSSPTELWIAHLLGSAVLILFIVGWKTRVTSVLALVVVLSYIHRAPMLTSQFEPILAFTMFYLCIAPAGRYLSIDRWLAARRGDDPTVLLPEAERRQARLSTAANISIRLLQVHVAVVYLMMGLAKLNGPAWWTGEAVWWLLAKPESRPVDLTGLLYQHTFLLNAWTHAIVLFELGFAVLIWNRLARPLLLALAVPMWALLSLATGLHLFCLMMLIASLAFIDPATFARLLPWVDAEREKAPALEPEPAAV